MVPGIVATAYAEATSNGVDDDVFKSLGGEFPIMGGEFPIRASASTQSTAGGA